MARNNPVPALAAAAVILALLLLDLHPALHHAPLLLLVLAGAVQVGRELAHAYAVLGRYPSAPSMNFLTCIVVIHLAYFAQPVASSLLELLGTVAVAMYTLVVVAAGAPISGPWAAAGGRLHAALGGHPRGHRRRLERRLLCRIDLRRSADRGGLSPGRVAGRRDVGSAWRLGGG